MQWSHLELPSPATGLTFKGHVERHVAGNLGVPIVISPVPVNRPKKSSLNQV